MIYSKKHEETSKSSEKTSKLSDQHDLGSFLLNLSKS